MKLVISEKNIAARRMATILSNGKYTTKRIGPAPVYEFEKDNEPWKIIGLRGHITQLDYPVEFNQWKKIEPKELISVEPVKKVSEKHISNALKSLAKQNPFIIVATDYDREGELIGVEALSLIQSKEDQTLPVKRAKFSAITKYEIEDAFTKLSSVDFNLSSAAEARQIVDLVWGAVLTRFISLTAHRLGKDFLSIGRVQSPTLALIVKREKEIKNFISKPFWKIIASLQKEKTFDVVHSSDKIWDETEAKTLYEKVKDASKAQVTTVEKEQKEEFPPSPFSTTTFLQAASYLGLATDKAMSTAEELYMSGLISYPRTDNTVYPKTLSLKTILTKLSQKFPQEVDFVNNHKRRYPSRGKKQTTDHPPIHPVDSPGSKKLTKDQQKIYELICRRFFATLTKNALTETMQVTFSIKNETFNASGYRVIEPNWKHLYPYIKEKRTALPELSKDEILPVVGMAIKKDKTRPPQRYTQGALIAKMEQLSLGTKSTRHEIIKKLYYRRYIFGNTPRPTATAIAVIDALVDCDVVKPDMTAQLENDMNSIAEGKKTLEEIVGESRDMLQKVMVSLEKDKEDIKNNIGKALKEQNKMGTCPKCGKDLTLRISKKGKRFIGCTGYPDCRNVYSLPQKGGIMGYDEPCKTCGAPVVRIKLKGKRLWHLCVNPECPEKTEK